VLAQTARLGRARCLAQYLAGVSSRTQRTEATAVERVFPGREFCSRQKRGAGVGKTKRGKGTKWMVVVDGQGLPCRDEAEPLLVDYALHVFGEDSHSYLETND